MLRVDPVESPVDPTRSGPTLEVVVAEKQDKEVRPSEIVNARRGEDTVQGLTPQLKPYGSPVTFRENRNDTDEVRAAATTDLVPHGDHQCGYLGGAFSRPGDTAVAPALVLADECGCPVCVEGRRIERRRVPVAQPLREVALDVVAGIRGRQARFIARTDVNLDDVKEFHYPTLS